MAALPFKYKFKPSPNYTAGRRAKISIVVIHWIVGNLAAADRVFANRSSGVSAHYGVENGTVHQYVREKDTAWHAISANPFSIGIEHSAAPGRSPSASTYKTTAELIARICKEHKLNPDKAIQPHAKYVQTRCPGTDANGKIREPGGIDIARIKRDVKAILKTTSKPAPKPKPKPKLKPFKRYLKRGSSGSDVDYVHRRLHKMGLYNAAFDKHFGPLTEKAVKAFQRKRKLVPDGWVGPITWKALQI